MPFNWHVYLSETGAEVSPPTLFEHVCRSLRTTIRKGCTLEALVVDTEDSYSTSVTQNESKWWPAEIVLISGYLLLLRWCVPGERSSFSASTEVKKFAKGATVEGKYSDCFWFDVKGSDWNSIRPIGWCRRNNIRWCPPKIHSELSSFTSQEQQTQWFNELKPRAVPDMFFEQHALYHYETIKVGGYFECEHLNDPRCVWPVQVLLNVGGRVKLMWFGSSSTSSHETDSLLEASVFTLFYLHRRIHPLGWAKSNGLSYIPPPGIALERSITNIDTFLRGALSAVNWMSTADPGNLDKFNSIYRHRPASHEFKTGWKLEAVNPIKPYLVQPATVAQVFDSHYFLVRLDDLSATETMKVHHNGDNTELKTPTNALQFVSYANSAKIMPVNTSQLRGLHLAPPPGWSTSRPFTWTNYLTFLSTNRHRPVISNGLLRAASTSNLVSTTQPISCGSQMSEELYSINERETGFVHSPSSSLLTDDSSMSIDNVPYCPSESVFRGTQLPDVLRSSSSQPDVSSALQHETTIPNDTELDSSAPTVPSRVSCSEYNSTADRFLLGMKLELVLPRYLRRMCCKSSEIGPALCTGTVTRILGAHLLWVLPDLDSALFDPPESPKAIMVDSRSTQLYPVGWAAFVGHPIIAPAGYEHCEVEPEHGLPTRPQPELKSEGAVEPTSVMWDVGLRLTHSLQFQTITYDSEEISPPVYINTKCYLGPFLCKTSLELLPRRFGPGPTTRVMHYLLTRLVSAAYKPIRVLRMFEADWASSLASASNAMRSTQYSASETDTVSAPSTRSRLNMSAFQQAETEMIEQRRSAMCVVLLRIRCPRRGIKIEAPVEVCCRARAVEEFCRQISLVLEACPHLISLTPPTQCFSESTPSSTHSAMDIFSPLTTLQKKTRDAKAVLRKELSFGSFMFSSTSPECPSFCASRLRSRNLDRLPGWKRRMFASLRPFGIRPPADVQVSSTGLSDISTTGLRTRSAMAGAQQSSENNGMTGDATARDISGFINGPAIGEATRKNKSRVSNRFRGAVRRVQSQRILYSGQDSPLHTTKRSLNSAVALDLHKRLHDMSPEAFANAATGPNPGGVQVGNYEHPSRYAHAYYPWRSHIFSLNGFASTEGTVPSIPDTDAGPYCAPTVLHSSTYDQHLPDSALSSFLADAPRVTLTSNPLFWSPVELASYLGETDCREMWPWLAAEAVDGQAFMLLTLPVLHHLVGLRWEDAIRLARHVVSVKRAFMEQFGSDFSGNSTSCSTPS